ncbi:hypothetical protein ACWDA7_23955 [Streptomyces sp. NPDC001156]
MAVDRLPGGVREFADYLNALLTRLDQGGGWCGVFWQRDPEGMRACLDGREVPPWDVVEALLHDLGAAYGPEAATGEAERARALHGASLAAYDAGPGGGDALGHRLDVMLHEQRRAADRQADLGRRLENAATREEADSLRLDLAWAHDDHERATARCGELRRRMEALDHRATRPLAEGAGDFRAAGAVDGGWPGETGGGAVRGREGQRDRGASGPLSQGAGDFRATGPVDGGWPGETASTAVRGTGRDGEAVGRGAEVHPVGGGGWPEGRVADGPDGAGGGPGGAGAEWPEARRADPARARSARWPEGLDASGVPVGDRGWPEGRGASGQDGVGGGPGGAGAEWPEARRVAPARWPEGRDASGVPVSGPGRPDGSDAGGPGAGAQAPSVEARREADGGPATARPRDGGGVDGGSVWPDGHPGPEEHGSGSRAGGRPPADSAAPHPPVAEEPHPAAGQSEDPVKQRSRRRPRGSARFAGVMDVQEASAGPAPAPATSPRGPRGARFAGATAAGPPADTPSRRDVPDETDRRLTAETVAALTRLRAEGRSGEAHALLVEAAHWPPARYPLLADELHRAGLHADWTTLLWEAASLSVAGLVAAADALTSAGRTADGEQMLRQGVVRPAGEIGEAVLGLSEGRRHREVRALLDVYVRARTPEEAARSAAPDPQRLVPLLLEAARGVSDQRHWDLVHALRVAGLPA